MEKGECETYRSITEGSIHLEMLRCSALEEILRAKKNILIALFEQNVFHYWGCRLLCLQTLPLGASLHRENPG